MVWNKEDGIVVEKWRRLPPNVMKPNHSQDDNEAEAGHDKKP